MAKKFVLLLLVATGMSLSASAAAAQTYETGAVVLSDSSTNPGQLVVVSGSGCPPVDTVEVAVQGDDATTTSDQEGDFSAEIRSPSRPGRYPVTATCGSRVLRSTLTVVGGGATAGLPRTGSSDTIGFSRIGLALGAAGGALVVVARRRRGPSTVD